MTDLETYGASYFRIRCRDETHFPLTNKSINGIFCFLQLSGVQNLNDSDNLVHFPKSALSTKVGVNI